MLHPEYRYIGLDFETTGLDTTKDEPIQIGIVEMDVKGKVINEFVSYLKPQKDLNELKTIVGFITGLALEDLANAPAPSELEAQITSFFGPNTILIGHNISFDIAFLQKYFPSCQFAGSLDTYTLAQTFLHYQASYALEVLINGVNAHDALQDTKNALALFMKIVQRVFLLANTFPELTRYITDAAFALGTYLDINTPSLDLSTNVGKGRVGEGFANIKTGVSFVIPKLEKHLPANTSIAPSQATISTDRFEHQKKYYIGNATLKQFLESIVANKQIILAFSNLQKLDIAKSMLNDMGLKNIGFLKEEQRIDYEKFTGFMQKPSFTQEEINFILKYYSHKEQGLGILDLNCKSDHQIYQYLKNKREKTRYPIVLTTHHGLYARLQEKDASRSDYEILFMDTDRCFKTYNFFLSRPCDFYYVLSIIETFAYKRNLQVQIEQASRSENLDAFVNRFQMFIAHLYMETKPLFENTPQENIQISTPIVNNTLFYKSQLLRKQIKEDSLLLETELEQDDYAMLQKLLQHADMIFNTLASIQKRASNTDWYFTYSETTHFTSWPEFLDIFSNKVSFFTLSNKKGDALYPDLVPQKNETFKQIAVYEGIVEHILQHPEKTSIFVISTRKEESKKLLDRFCAAKINTTHQILIENVTGGMGKNLFKAKTNKQQIIVGGYAFLLSCYAAKIPLDECIIFNIKGGNEQLILDDITRYAPL